MKCKVSFEFETEGEMTQWLNAKSPMASAAVETMEKGIAKAETVKAPAVVEPAPEPVEVEEPVKAKAPKAPKAPAVVETLNPEAPTQKERDNALALLIAKIRGFVLADKPKNMKALLPLMPEGKKALDKLTLEEAQAITLKLGIE
jgi:hypothetical protein